MIPGRPTIKAIFFRIEFNNRYKYSFNPENEKYEKTLIQDYLEHPYADYSTAEAYRDEWEGIWQCYLRENIQKQFTPKEPEACLSRKDVAELFGIPKCC